jgi:putative heme transporter
MRSSACAALASRTEAALLRTEADPRRPPPSASAPAASAADPRRRSPQKRSGRSRRRLTWLLLLATVAVGIGLYVGLPQIAGVKDTWGRLSSGHPAWLTAALILEIASYGAYVYAFHGLFARVGSRIGWRESYEISLAGVAATRVLAAAGAGGIALTAWALNRSGRERRELVGEITTFYVCLYATFMAALVLVGVGLRSGVLSGPAPFGLTVVPALFGGFVITGALLTAKLPRDLDARVRGRFHGEGRTVLWLARAAGWSGAIAAGVRGAVALLRRRDTGFLGALGWWAFDVGVLWACFHAFGQPPSAGVLVMAYFTGMLGNVLPLPGGLGGVEGGMIGALIGFGVDDGLAVTAVLSYRAFAYWLPIVPGMLAYLRLRRTVKAWDRV